MGHNATVARNASWLIAQGVVTGPLAIVVTAFVARYLGAAQYGQLFLLLSYNAIFLAVSSLGLRSYGVREIASRRGDVLTIMGEMIVLRAALAAAAAVLGGVLLAVFEPNTAGPLVAMLVAMLFANSMALCFVDGLYGVERFKAVAMVMALSGAVVQAGCIAGVALDGGLSTVAAAYVAGAVGMLVASCWVFVSHVGMPHLAALRWSHFVHVRRSRVFFVQNIVTAVQLRADVVVINAMAGAHSAGLYGASMTLVQKIDLLHDGIATAMYPRVAELHGQGARGVRELVQSAVRMALVLSLPMAIGLFAISGDVVRIVFGDGFSESAIVLAVMAIGIPMRFLYGILFNVHTAMGRQRLVLVVSFAATLASLTLMAFAAWRWGALGAAAAGVAGLASTCTALCVAYASRNGALVGLRDTASLIACNGVLAALLWQLGDSALLVRIFVPAVAYAAMVLMLGLVPFAPVRAFLWSLNPLGR